MCVVVVVIIVVVVVVAVAVAVAVAVVVEKPSEKKPLEKPTARPLNNGSHTFLSLKMFLATISLCMGGEAGFMFEKEFSSSKRAQQWARSQLLVYKRHRPWATFRRI